jgi:hypothetical protein
MKVAITGRGIYGILLFKPRTPAHLQPPPPPAIPKGAARDKTPL